VPYYAPSRLESKPLNLIAALDIQFRRSRLTFCSLLSDLRSAAGESFECVRGHRRVYVFAADESRSLSHCVMAFGWAGPRCSSGCSRYFGSGSSHHSTLPHVHSPLNYALYKDLRTTIQFNFILPLLHAYIYRAHIM
jgi:hypothetical protein